MNKRKGKGGQGEGEMGNAENGNGRECEVLDPSPRWIGLLQYELQTLDQALADLCRLHEPWLHSIWRLTAMFQRAFILYSDTVAAGFVLLDAGPKNLGVEDDAVVFLDWEHIKKGKAKRTDINQQVKRVLAVATAHMAQFPRWSRIGTALQDLVFTSWWVTLTDEEIKSGAGDWLYEKGLHNARISC